MQTAQTHALKAACMFVMLRCQAQAKDVAARPTQGRSTRPTDQHPLLKGGVALPWKGPR